MSSSSDLQQTEAYRQREAASPSVPRLAHTACTANGIYLVALLLLLDIALVLLRRRLGHMQNYHFIPLNLFLASVPYGVSLCVAALHHYAPRRGWLRAPYALLLLPLYGLWLLFLPNAPYLLTDVVHLEDKTTAQIWYDTTMLATYAVTGYVLAIVSLALMHRPVRDLLGWRLGWLFVVVSLFLAGFGVHLGRAQRYNSSDMLAHPKTVLADAVDRLAHPYQHPHTMFDALYYAAILLVGYLAFLALRSKQTRAIILHGWDA